MGQPEATRAIISTAKSEASDEEVRSLQAQAKVAPPTQARPYRQAAAVLDSFDPQTLVPYPADDSASGPYPNYQDECQSTRLRAGERRWRLHPTLRADSLPKLATRDVMEEALRANWERRPKTALQEMLDVVLLGKLPDLAELGR
jgi:hypothetical protein